MGSTRQPTGDRVPATRRAPSAWIRKYGPWAVVTGASGGIGREIAREIGARGVNLVLVARREKELHALGRELSDHGIDIKVFAHDLTQRDARKALLDRTRALDVGLVVPAAGFGSSGLFEATDLSHELAMLELNCTAVLELVHGFLPRLIARDSGGIILFSSITAFQGVPYSAHYAATKAWNQSLAEGLSREMRPHGVDVLATAPATVSTGFADRAGMSMSAAASPEVVARATVQALGRRGTARPGFLARFLESGLMFLPRAMRTRVMGMVMKGMAEGRT